ncbi:hypothetical protein FEM48_Zijuj04G0054900 [Ziziphus jujuba var. spinosa]|uniref:Uncharacterized protein n=1 Tax=Ziziphus jujuba var. spinosa TaxID=714518 RepID=A0A978VI27_ZIZJJ|nr:hypothetical protein FEM48_Zijuj04G0054900 [Ziziphus jujuba var. spinosa]
MSCLVDNGSEWPSMNNVVWGLEFALQLWDESEQKSGGTKPSSSDQSSDINQSIKGMSGTVFSEINNPKAR